MTLVTAAFMDRAGRKPLLTASHAGMAACLAVMSAFMFLPSEFPAKPAAPRCAALPPPPPLQQGPAPLLPQSRSSSSAPPHERPYAPPTPCLPPSTYAPGAAPESLAGVVSFGSILAYVLFFALGSGPIPWVYLPEILPAEIKGNAQVLVLGGGGRAGRRQMSVWRTTNPRAQGICRRSLGAGRQASGITGSRRVPLYLAARGAGADGALKEGLRPRFPTSTDPHPYAHTPSSTTSHHLWVARPPL